MNEEAIFSKVKTIMDKLDKDQELQDLAERNGLNATNTARLTPTMKDNVAISIIAMLLAQNAGDPKYKKLAALGLEKRRLKVQVINDYKDQAKQLLEKYRADHSDV